MDGKRKSRIYNQVKEVLRTLPYTRNNDAALIVSIWTLFYPHKLSVTTDGRPAFTDESVIELGGNIAKFESIRRVRQIVQNDEKLYLPTDWNVARGRRIKKEVWEAAMRERPRNTAVL